jgi:hypothetical protein
MPSAKRRRADSPVNHQQSSEKPTLTFEQLKLQYGNLSVNKNRFFLFLFIDLVFLGRSIKKTFSNDKKS